MLWFAARVGVGPGITGDKLRATKAEEDAARLTQPEVLEVWDSLVKTEIGLLYWGCQMRLRMGIDQWIKILILVSSLSCVTSWVLVAKHPFIWQAISVLVAVISIVQVVLDFSGRANEMSKIHDKLLELQCEYDELWRSLPITPRKEAITRFNVLKRSEKPIAEASAKMHYWSGLHERCFTQGCIARGLISPIQQKGKQSWLTRTNLRIK